MGGGTEAQPEFRFGGSGGGQAQVEVHATTMLYTNSRYKVFPNVNDIVTKIGELAKVLRCEMTTNCPMSP